MDLALYEGDMGPIRQSDTEEFDKFLWLMDKAIHYPAVFKLLPLEDPKPDTPGTWAGYPFDDKLRLWINSSHPEALEYFKEYQLKKKEALMTKALTTNEQGQIRSLLAKNMKAITSVMPKHLTPERLMRIAYQAIMKTPKLAECTQFSLINAVIAASQLGLEISGPLGQASLIPYGKEAQLIVEYKGKIALAYNTGKIKHFSTHPVYEKDTWSYEYGLNPFLRHRPADGPRGDLIAAYAVVEYVNGGKDFEVVDKAIAMRAKNKSAAKNKADSPWNKDEDEWTMWVKTAVHQLSKRVPQSPELQLANALDEKAESGEGQNLDIIDIELEEMPDGAPNGKKKEDEPKRSPEDQKIVDNFEVTKNDFPKEYGEVCAELGIKPDDTPPIELMKTIYMRVSAKVGG